jgi:tetraacyldisaccharide 4'-kinase
VGGVVSNGDNVPTASVREAGDEAYMMAVKAPRIPVIVGSDRVAATEKARDLGATVVVLDSGFQHRRLARDLDIVTVSLPLGEEEALLPRGQLREPLSALGRADIVGWEMIGDELPPLPTSQRRFTYRLKPEHLVDERLARCGELSELEGSHAIVITGIARPHRFRRTVRDLGASVADVCGFPDHHMFTSSEWGTIMARARRKAADVILTTEKDMVRLVAADLGDTPDSSPLRAISVNVEIEDGDDVLDEALESFT